MIIGHIFALVGSVVYVFVEIFGLDSRRYVFLVTEALAGVGGGMPKIK